MPNRRKNWQKKAMKQKEIENRMKRESSRLFTYTI